MKKNEFKVDFIGIGAEKSGTTWLADMLDEHPEICISSPKEIRYFNEKYSFFRKEKSNYEEHSFQWYKKHFSHCKKGQLKGEISPIYFFDKAAPKRIKRHFPNVKLILILRNPVEKTYSLYWMCRTYLNVEKRDFEQAIGQEPEYIEKAMYAKQLQRYLDYFELSQIKILFLEEVKTNPKKEIKKLYQFLRVANDDFVPTGIDKKSNFRKKTRIKWVIFFMGKITNFFDQIGASFILRFLKKLGVKKAALMIATEKYQCPPMKETTKKYLSDTFSKDIEKLEKMLNKDLSFWNND